MLTHDQRTFWDDNGYVVVEDVLSPARVAEVADALEHQLIIEGDQAGAEGSANPGVRRLCNLVTKGPVFEGLATEPIVLAMAAEVIGDAVHWQAMNFHDPLPGDPRPHQPIHADRSFFANCTAYLNVIWVIDAMTPENGAPRVVPGSHKGPWPLDLADADAPVPGEVNVTAPAGAAVFVHGDTWHGGRANATTTPRRVIHLGFANPGTAPQYKMAEKFDAAARARLGPHARLIPGPLADYGLSDDPTKGLSLYEVIDDADPGMR